MYAIQSGFGIVLPVIADCHAHQCLAIAENIVNNRSPGMNVIILDTQIRTEAKVYELIGARE
ncbi:hypothetical protein WS84_19900 [Burkholderia anthina]|nr:hypothetical protein WS85_22640 [Burkholderia anthina]KVH08035.1 hypothetical protein WS84_19900 [Burkholderia anthina]KVM90572.1 hypothetical protein WT06_18320 [Burkholderia anthina]KVN51663.1 hypothetical protein WT13_00880 [Burkholderia anthina]KVX35357.1 hypothetical protein WT32_17110 [Burkholderia anthina]